jgi:hypothetical protein
LSAPPAESFARAILGYSETVFVLIFQSGT